ncbi:hypothetical protein C1I98_21590 [Spongiactinospora gelatinilytica]|uniref:Uncharacterized protein n=1 Tax=Spongiactinospora gelatinilytica TaxID=2666298 RepID=A0A2W2GF39_9ACTN|nr:hypothetical protein [Spongiactinospora gelatinilytica]PZG41219.1 hypothetical protein C1I98_21590 [Spongiactinospora gelatinilytica]
MSEDIHGYRPILAALLTDPAQLALDLDRAEHLVGQMEDTLDAAGWRITPVQRADAAGPRPTVFGPTTTLILRQLVPGVYVRRYTVLGRGGTVWAEMPCCDRQARLPLETHTEFRVQCASCRLDYTVVLVDENDGGYTASFQVTDDGTPIIARRRRGARPLG